MTAPSKTRPHLGETDFELALFELQHTVVCYSEAFYRYVEMQLKRVTGNATLTGQDCVILHGIRLGERPKSIPEIQHFTNRTDIANIQYSVKKLMKAGLVEKADRNQGRGTTYRLTEVGVRATDEYVRARREFIMTLRPDPTMLEEVKAATRLLQMLTGAYDHVTRSLI
ncbi:MAG TPA: winged helix DNA-binding protein [Alphaproteobacteria bacterium]